jgi:hypothetical protein
MPVPRPMDAEMMIEWEEQLTEWLTT